LPEFQFHIAKKSNCLLPMKLSKRRAVDGDAVSAEKGAVAAVVKLRAGHPFLVAPVIAKEAVEDLILKKGEHVKVITRSTEVIIAKD
jgi:molybdopterin-binding protein